MLYNNQSFYLTAWTYYAAADKTNWYGVSRSSPAIAELLVKFLEPKLSLEMANLGK